MQYLEDLDSMKICAECIDNSKLSEFIKKHGSLGQCSFNNSHKRDYVLSISNFCEHYDKYFRGKYCHGSEFPTSHPDSDKIYFDTYGDSLEETVSIDLGCEPEITDAVIRSLIDNEPCFPQDGDEPFYDELTNFELIEEADERERRDWDDFWYDNKVSFQWQDFCKKVIYGNRFFNIKEQLDDLFGNVENYSKQGRRPVYTINEGTHVYRARKLTHELTETKIKANPQKELGAPQADIAVAGRMNVQHIPAFYAAFSPDVALQELQPYISEKIAIGKFTLKRKIKVFDFTVFDKVFDEKYALKGMEPDYTGTYYDVVTNMQNEISKPISNDNKTREYIPTQVLTEYIQEHFDVDAIIFFSSLFSKTEEIDRRNIVFLNKKFQNGNFEVALKIDTDNIKIKSVTYIQYEAIEDPSIPF